MTPGTIAESVGSARISPLDLSAAEFRRLGHELVDQISEFLEVLRDRPLTGGETPAQIRALLGRATLPQTGTAPATLLPDTARLLFDHSLFNGHPRFLGYITSSAAPLGMLADLLAAAVNPNVGGWELSPMASEIEAQTCFPSFTPAWRPRPIFWCERLRIAVLSRARAKKTSARRVNRGRTKKRLSRSLRSLFSRAHRSLYAARAL